ncbi:Pantoate--beta-alanine ligase [Liberibacter crescens BT-1]|uniref:Pantothenate synthetase n=1 Tax=Liberibacter crescens (strain BT-1) TaxID=1215343 RepID=L0EVG7_LIBCB|nr:pantoate--beta-alanine ligase [Liberibacter crescens]AGA64391.1 Pantoate--beta-alanine ligase [Liberibacter crescens BT-1]AMC12576.1 pantoate--beta-alanine ligase [Liberibacter crescens]
MIIETVPILRHEIRCWRHEGKRIAFVPTMGNLHEGHLTLIKEAQKISDRLVVSIFVNPMQFNDLKDFEKYPRTLQEDCEKLKYFDVDIIFFPSADTMYPKGMQYQTYVEVPDLSDILDSASRPGHFRGVTTVVSKLFNLVQPDVAFFGEKDFQQLHLIRRMVIDLEFDIKIISIPTVRDNNGLALSSRNTLLSQEEKKIAPKLYQVMTSISREFTSGNFNIEFLLTKASDQLRHAGFMPEPLFIRDAITLQPLTDQSEKAVILMAAFLGKTRLIDNLQVNISRYKTNY